MGNSFSSLGLTFDEVSEANAQRCARWHGSFPNHDTDDFSGGDWANAMQGEAGEAGNVVKKLRRLELRLASKNNGTKEELLLKLRKEIGDTFIYLDLLASYYELNTGECVRYAFNQVSEREGFPERI
jgi:NTP pyrophosphatase (non-canonical NTP hydrolase)